MNGSCLRRLLTSSVVAVGIGTVAPSAGQAETLLFDLNVDSALGVLGGPSPLKLAGTVEVEYGVGSSLDFEARLEVVETFEFTKDSVTATLGGGTIRFALPGKPVVQIDVVTPGFEPIGPNPGTGGQIADPGFAGLIWDYGLHCVIDHCGPSLHFKIMPVDDPNSPNEPDPKFAPLTYSENNTIYQLYFSVDVTNTVTGARGTVGGTLRQSEVPVPGAAWSMGTVVAGAAGFRAWRRRRVRA
jgi:hypothetical protein